MVKPDGGWTDSADLTLERDELFIRQANSFLDAIEGGPPPPCPLAEGLQTLRVNLAILRSIEEQRWQSVSS
jgi:predicted dehydrogenase